DARRTDGGGSAPDATPGEVVSVSGDGGTVQSGGGRILLKRVRPEGGGKIPAAEWASNAGVSAGTKLGN
ncbi:MAG TPA: hypothetical protein VK844_07540, partial [Hyphomicrobiales bacterium]|nr:hypothetical protein [Hyphomicrobiales bacterium]